MRRVLLALAFIVFTHIAGQAQPQAYDARVDYQKGQQSVAAIDLPYSGDSRYTGAQRWTITQAT